MEGSERGRGNLKESGEEVRKWEGGRGLIKKTGVEGGWGIILKTGKGSFKI